MTRECIVLAGGLGTRLKTVTGDTPKCLAPVAGRPFLHYVFKYLETHGLEHVILALGYKHEQITDWCDKNRFPFSLSYAIEKEPLGTGGAIKNAWLYAREKEAFILNGDTLFTVDLPSLNDFHHRNNAVLSLSLKPMRNFDRYGRVALDDENRIRSFEEKHFYEQGLINGGVYLMEEATFLRSNPSDKFSFENDYLVPFASRQPFFGFISDRYFIDIGIPEDYERAQEEIEVIFSQ